MIEFTVTMIFVPSVMPIVARSAEGGREAQHQAFELHLAYESDLPLDRGSFTQTYAYALGAWSFDFKKDPSPLETRGQVQSP